MILKDYTVIKLWKFPDFVTVTVILLQFRIFRQSASAWNEANLTTHFSERFCGLDISKVLQKWHQGWETLVFILTCEFCWHNNGLDRLFKKKTWTKMMKTFQTSKALITISFKTSDIFLLKLCFKPGFNSHFFLYLLWYCWCQT